MHIETGIYESYANINFHIMSGNLRILITCRQAPHET